MSRRIFLALSACPHGSGQLSPFWLSCKNDAYLCHSSEIICVFLWTPPESSPKDFGSSSYLGSMWLYKKEWEAKIRAKPNKKSEWGEIISIVFPQANNQERQILTVETSAVLLMLMADSGVGCTAISAKPGLGLRTFSKESFRSLILLCKTWFFNIPGKTPKHPYFPSLSRSSPTFRT